MSFTSRVTELLAIYHHERTDMDAEDIALRDHVEALVWPDDSIWETTCTWNIEDNVWEVRGRNDDLLYIAKDLSDAFAYERKIKAQMPTIERDGTGINDGAGLDRDPYNPGKDMQEWSEAHGEFDLIAEYRAEMEME